MVSKISTGQSIRGMLHYNENKVTAGEAKLILASGFAGEIEQMSFLQKLHRFQHLQELKPNVKTNAMHVSLNFDASENISTAKMQQIAMAYMEKIGFGDQPFLVYRHDDSKHQHLHIVTTNITAEKQRIDLHNIGWLLSEPARKAIEKEFDLVEAKNRQYKMEPAIKPADLEKAIYGKIPTKRAISNVVGAVMNTYAYTSLAEFNAILKQFNVMATRGKEHTAMYEKKGLMYTLLDQHGNPVGVPIKSSAFYSKPTLRNLEKKVERNLEKRQPYREELKRQIDKVFSKYHSITQATFIAELHQRNIRVAFRTNEQGYTYGATFIDHYNRVVFNGSDLGKAYAAKALTERFQRTDQPKQREQKSQLRTAPQSGYLKQQQSAKTYLPTPAPPRFLQMALAKSGQDSAPGVNRKKKRRKTQGQEQDQELTL